MNAMPHPSRTLPSRRFERFARHESGIAAVEFSLILPILVVLWIGGVEVTQALSVDRRLNNLASALGDLSARTKVLSHAEVDNIFDIGPGAMFPFCDTQAECSADGLVMRITAVNMDEDGNPEVAWTRMRGTLPAGVPAYEVGDDVDEVPETLRAPDSQLIMSEVYYSYTPAVGYVITSTIGLEDQMYFVPRLVQHVQLCDNNGENCQS
jgi:Flp pilus assembly protein TadG